jgi:DNA-nicking Smr family endonuclease
VALKIKIINLEENRPTVEQMRVHLDRVLIAARYDGTAILKLIHGYGSSGVGGKLRVAVRASLTRYKKSAMIQEFISGEEFRISNEATWALLKAVPEMKQDRDLGRENKGITVVVLESAFKKH